jgi:hypothetical protein
MSQLLEIGGSLISIVINFLEREEVYIIGLYISNPNFQ